MNGFSRPSTTMSQSLSVQELPNLPGMRRDISLINPKLYKEFKASRGEMTMSRGDLFGDARAETPYVPVEGDGSLMSYFENSNKLIEYSKSLSAFPAVGTAYNDITGRYSLRSQQQDRLSKSRSLPYCHLNAAPAFVCNDSKSCQFIAFFTEYHADNPLEPVRTRKVQIVIHLEDSSIEITEPKINNSGLPSGKMLKRHQVMKPVGGSTFMGTSTAGSPVKGGAIYTIDDFKAGAQLNIYNRIYTIADADAATKRLMEENGSPFGDAVPLPDTFFDPLLASKMKKGGTKKKAVSSLFEYGRKMLRFYGVWDSREQFFGDELLVRLHYSLAEDAMEVLPIHTRNSGRDKLARILKRTKIMMTNNQDTGSSFDDSFDMTNLQPSRPYHWTDLHIGMRIAVAALDIVILDADEFTREFYVSKNKPLAPKIVLPQAIYPQKSQTIPPHNGFGSEADSLQTCGTSLMPGPPHKDGAKAKLYQGMILRYCAKLTSPKPEDITRSFIIQVHLEDDTIQIREPPVRNSGHKGGIFLARNDLEMHDGNEPIKAHEIYLGAQVKILSHSFIVTDADEFTLRFMEEHCSKWNHADLKRVEEKLKRQEDIISRAILTIPGLSSKTVTIADVQEIFKRAGIDCSKQEVTTIFRVLDPKRVGSIKPSTILMYLKMKK